jgi:hypothetical protein
LKGYFVTLSLIGLFAILLAFSAKVRDYSAATSLEFSGHGWAQKISGAKGDISRNLGELYGTRMAATSAEGAENVTIFQSASANGTVLESYRRFVSGTLSAMLGANLSLDNTSAGGPYRIEGPGGLYYDCNYSTGSFTLSSTAQSTNISSIRLSIVSDADRNGTEPIVSASAGSLPVRVDYSDLSGTYAYEGDINGSGTNYIFINASGGNKTVNISLGNIGGTANAIFVSAANMTAEWNITFPLQVAGQSPSEWHFQEVFSAGSPGISVSSRVPVGIGRA